MSPAVRHGIIGAILFAVLLVVGAYAVSYMGLYNVAADEPHLGIVTSFLGSTMDHSVAARDGDLVPPANLKDPQMVAAGAAIYSKACAGCHLAPGVTTESRLRVGLYPKPPSFARRRRPGNPKEQFWIVKHGIKMTGMPAWGASLPDSDIWNIVAFLQAMPGMTGDSYKSLSGQQ